MLKLRNKRVPAEFTTPRQVYAATVAEMDRQVFRLLMKIQMAGLDVLSFI